jgi:pyruvate kinase
LEFLIIVHTYSLSKGNHLLLIVAGAVSFRRLETVPQQLFDQHFAHRKTSRKKTKLLLHFIYHKDYTTDNELLTKLHFYYKRSYFGKNKSVSPRISLASPSSKQVYFSSNHLFFTTKASLVRSSMSKLTKIVATLGPATESLDSIIQLIQAGMNVARFNTKHNDPAWHSMVMQRVHEAADAEKQPVAILLDLQGPEIRIDLPNQQPFSVAVGDIVTFTSNPATIAEKLVIIPHEAVISLKPGNHVLLADGECEFEVLEIQADQFLAKATQAATVKPRKTMNTPGVVMSMPSLTDRDRTFLQEVDLTLVNFVGLSFVRDAKDIAILRDELAKRNSKAHIIAKIENQKALDNLDEIIAAADGIMVARGDLGVEVPFEELTHWQKTIIYKSRVAAKPVITATEMLKSMMKNPRPTRAEVSDVANAIYDGTDAVMLSDETTIGEYPVKAVHTQAKIAAFNEPLTHVEPLTISMVDNVTAITEATFLMLETDHLTIDKIICLTETGRTARLISRFRPHIPTFALTSSLSTYRQLNLLYSVTPIIVHDEITFGDEESLITFCKDSKIVNTGEKIVLIRGKFWRKPGFTNTLSIIDVP